MATSSCSPDERPSITDTPSAADSPDYLAKYHEHIGRIGMNPETFAQRYSVPVRIQLERLSGH